MPQLIDKSRMWSCCHFALSHTCSRTVMNCLLAILFYSLFWGFHPYHWSEEESEFHVLKSSIRCSWLVSFLWILEVTTSTSFWPFLGQKLKTELNFETSSVVTAVTQLRLISCLCSWMWTLPTWDHYVLGVAYRSEVGDSLRIEDKSGLHGQILSQNE